MSTTPMQLPVVPRQKPVVEIHRTDDFEITGRGTHPAWNAVASVPMIPRQQLDRPELYTTWFKSLWSPRGIYFFIDCGDPKLSAQDMPNFSNLFIQDVVEIFLWPDTSTPLYFEYQVSPYGKELAILVPNFDRRFHGWMPWHYEDNRVTRHATNVRGGPAQPGATITGWSAEAFIPSTLLTPLRNAQPAPGVTWRAKLITRDSRAASPRERRRSTNLSPLERRMR